MTSFISSRVSSLGWTLLSLALVACSGGRSDPVGADCVTDRQCASGEACVSGSCQELDGTHVTGRVAGAPEDVQVEAEGEDCQSSDDGGVVCQLSGDGLTLVAPVVEGYRFSGWSGGAGCSGDAPELQLSKVKKSITCTANYVRRVRVRGEITGEGGAAIVASSDGELAHCEPGGCEVDAGQVVVLLAPARDGFRLSAFEGEGCEVRDGYRVIVTTDQSDVLCVASYVESLTVRGQTQNLGDVANTPEGEVRASADWEGALCDGPLCAIDPGVSVTLEAPQPVGFRFRGWTGDPACASAEPALTLPDVQSNLTCTADYAVRHTVRGESEGAAAPITASADNAFASCEGAACEVDESETVTLLAGTVEGFRLSEWTGEGCEPLAGASAVARMVSGDVTCTAHYVEGVSVIGTLINAEGEIVAESQSAGAECGRGMCAIDVGGEVTLTAPRLAGRTFLGWSGDPGCEGSELSVTLPDVRQSKACVATYAARYTVVVSASPADGGEITVSTRADNASCSPGRCVVDQGSAVTVTARANAGHRFTGFSGGGPCLALGDTLSLPDVQSSITCSANFVRRIEVSGVVSPRQAGTVTASQLSLSSQCSGASCTVDAGSDVSLVVQPADPGWTFSGWTGCGSPLNPLLGSPNLPVLGPREDTVCTANFTRVTYPVSASAGPGGSVSVSTTLPCPGNLCSVDYDGAATLRAAPNACYAFGGWSGDCSGGEPQLSLRGVRMPYACMASFAPIPVTVGGGTNVAEVGVVASSPAGQCSGASCTLDCGGAVDLDVGPLPPGFTFAGWEPCPGGVALGTRMHFDSATSSQQCRARITPPVAVFVDVIGGSGGSASCVGLPCVVAPGSPITLTAQPLSGWYVQRWSCDNGFSIELGAGVSDLTSSPPITVPPNGMRCTVDFQVILI